MSHCLPPLPLSQLLISTCIIEACPNQVDAACPPADRPPSYRGVTTTAPAVPTMPTASDLMENIPGEGLYPSLLGLDRVSPAAERTQSTTAACPREQHSFDAGQFPMVEVANPAGGRDTDNPATILVYRPWSPADLRDVASTLPDPETEGGEEFVRVFLQIVNQYRPTSVEIETILMKALQLKRGRVKRNWPSERNIMFNWDAHSNYRSAVEQLSTGLIAAFPKRMNWEKISDCKQTLGEKVSDYRNRLEKAFELHSGMGKRPDGDEESAWEQQCKMRLVAGLLPDIRKHIQNHCVDLDEGRMETVWPYFKHAERVYEDQLYKQTEERRERETQIQMA
ncbi:hypothetical protein DPEC_G00331160, partial [Dallia pectoralis]